MKLLVSILGPTGIGKTKVAIILAKYFNTEIISCDSRQFYKELKIGTSCPTYEELKTVKHHFIGNKTIFDDYNISIYEKEALIKLNKIYNKKKIVILVGGSFLYEKAIIEGINKIPNINKKKLYNYREKLNNKNINFLLKSIKNKDNFFFKKKLNNKKDKRKIIRALEIYHFTKKKISYFYKKKKKSRPFKRYLRICLMNSREKIYNNINNKVNNMINNGLIYEAKKLYKYNKLKLNSLNTIGYKELFNFFKKKNNIIDTIESIKKKTRNYAKKQISWLNNMKNINFFKPNKIKKIIKFINKKLINR